MTYSLGIDLGTTYTAAAIARSGRAEVVTLGYRMTSIPTVVVLTENGTFLVGDAAERRATSSPERLAREFKRRVGDPTPLLLGVDPRRRRAAGPGQQPDDPERDEGREDDRRTTPQHRRHSRACYEPSETGDAPCWSGAAGAPGS